MEVDLDLRALLAEGVAVRVSRSLATAPMSPASTRDIGGLAALHDAEMREALLAAPRVVFDGGVVLTTR